MQHTYKIGEAATLLNLKTYVLRFWETEFPQIAPLRTDKGQRLYTQEHVALLAYIRYLLHEKGLTIEGARKELQRGLPDPLPFPLLPPRQPSLLDETPDTYAAQAIVPASMPPSMQEAAENPLPPAVAPLAPTAQPVQPTGQPGMQPPVHQPDGLDSNTLHHLLDELEAVADLLRA